MKFNFSHRGSFDNLERFLSSPIRIESYLHSAGRRGVAALSAATPVATGLAANLWDYYVENKGDHIRVVWTNSDVERGFPVVIALQYGYGTGTGGYVQGRDFINPAIQPIFDEISNAVEKAVSG